MKDVFVLFNWIEEYGSLHTYSILKTNNLPAGLHTVSRIASLVSRSQA